MTLGHLPRPRDAAALALAALLSSAAHADFANGGFENGLDGWTVDGFIAEGFDYGLDALAHAGQSAFYGGGIGTPGTLSQTVDTVAGQAYVLSFWLAGDGFLPNEFTVLADGAPLLRLTDAALMPLAYQQVSVFFTAGAAATAFGFALRSDSGAFHLDDVALAAVPEPAAALLMGAGIAGLAAVARLRRRDAAAR